MKINTSAPLMLGTLLLAALAVGCGAPAPEEFDDAQAEAFDESEELDESGAYDDLEADELDPLELGELTQALNSSCGNSTPNLVMNTDYSNSNVKSGLGQTNFVSNYDNCGKGFFVQVESFEPYAGGRIGVPTGDFSGISESECDDVVTRLYVWVKQSNGSFRFVDSHSQGGAWRNNRCVQRFDHVRQDRLERSLTRGATVKYALTARRANDATLPVRMHTDIIVR